MPLSGIFNLILNAKYKMNEEIQEHKHNTKYHPDENSGFYLESHIKIYDPETNEIIVDKRDD